MYTLITVLIFIICVLLVLIVLVQNSKGGGLASNFQSAGQVMGVRKTTDFLEKATWSLAGALLVLSIIASAFIPRANGVEDSRVRQQIENAVDPTQVPNFPTTAPAQDETTTPPAAEDGNN
ncbi:MAG: preprotein translocase subunit SecG [Draconibacterium sp.]